MQLFSFLPLLATALAAKSFGALNIRSGSQYQYSTFVSSGNDVLAGASGDSALDLVLNDDGSLVDTKSKKYVNVGSDGQLTLSETLQTGFSFKDTYLAYDDNEAFGVCDGAKITFNKSACEGIAVSVKDPKDTANVYPGASTTAVTSTTKAESQTTTKSVCKTSTTAKSSTASGDSITAGKKFGLIAIHSGSSVQNQAIKKVDSHPHVFAVGGNEGSDLELTFSSDLTTLSDLTGRGVNLDDSTGELGSVAPFGRQAATSGFSIKDGELTFDGSSSWSACPSAENVYSLSHKDCEGGIGIALKVVYV